MAEQIFVVQSAGGSGYRGQHHIEYPPVVPEVYAFALAAPRHHEERDNGKGYSCPLVRVKPLAEDYHGSEQREHGLGGFYRPCYGNGEVLEGKVCEYPRGKYYCGFQYYVQVLVYSYLGNVEKCSAHFAGGEPRGDYQRQEQQAAKQGVEEEYGNDGIVF